MKYSQKCFKPYHYVLVTLLFLIYVKCFNWGKDERPKSLKIDRLLGKCPKHKNALYYLQDIRLLQYQQKFYIKTQIVIMDESSDDLKVELTAKKCQSREALDTCERTPVLTIDKFCQIVMEEEKPWTPFVKSITPHIECPFQKGIYTTINASIDVDSGLMHPFEGYYWKAEARLIDNKKKKVLFCGKLEGQIVYMQKKGA